MTATHVEGRTVVASEPAPSPLSTEAKPVYFTRILRLLLDDESTYYGCAECDFTSARIAIIRGHLGRLHPEGRVRARKVVRAVAQAGSEAAERPEVAEPSDGDVMDMTIGDLLRLAQRFEAQQRALDRMTESRNEWKTRAAVAERKLATFRKALAS